MKIFIVGLPKSGRTTVSQSITNIHGWQYIDAISWIKNSFRSIRKDEHLQQFEDEFQQFLSKKMMFNPNLVVDHVNSMMSILENANSTYVIDGLLSPRDFSLLFDYRQDIVVFLNRVDNEYELRDHENIGASVIRDYCFWMSAAGLIMKERWLEYNFRIPGEEVDYVKKLGAQNSVFIVRSLKKVIEHLSERVRELTHAVSI